MLALAATGPAAFAQYPRARKGQFEVRGRDFSANGGWRKRVNAIREARHGFIRAGAIRALNQNAGTAFGGTKVTGHLFVPVLPIAFPNAPPSAFTSEALLQDQIFSPAPVGRPYSLKTFYEQMSNNYITLDGTVFPWVTAINNDTYYEDGCNGIGVANPCPNGGSSGAARLGQLLIEALNAASNRSDAATVWAAYDNDGPDGVPNSGDDDGVVDVVTFLQPEQDGACQGSPHIWAHRFVIAPMNGGSPYVTKTPWAGHPGSFLKVNDYTMQSAVGGNSSCSSGQIMPIGTIAHETGHVFGLPDLYDTGGGTATTEGIGEWGLMGSGNYAKPYSPSRMEAWSLLELGWVAVDTLGASGTVRLAPVTSGDQVLYVGVPNTSEFFLLENRQALESDSAQMSLNLPLTAQPGYSLRKTPGLLVWHVDQAQVDAHGFSGDNRVNVGPRHGVALVQADGSDDLGAIGIHNYGDAGDSYPGSTDNRTLTLMSVPSAVDNSGRYAGFVIDSIYQVVPQGEMIFRFVRKQPSLFAAAQSGALIRVNGTAMASYSDVLPAATRIQLSADSVQATADAGSRFEFRSWSDGGDRIHEYVAGESADTVRATFEAAYRLRVQLVNALAEAVAVPAAPAGGDYATGVFVPGGQPITLVAAPPVNTIFAGWSGDTTTSNLTLVLPMNRPYAVSATFTSVSAISVNVAADALLGKAPLTADQAAYLDGLGNRNGSFDIGDFLAYVRLTGVTPSAAVMAKLMAAADSSGATTTERKRRK